VERSMASPEISSNLPEVPSRLTGGCCMCRAARYEISEQPMFGALCHCQRIFHCCVRQAFDVAARRRNEGPRGRWRERHAGGPPLLRPVRISLHTPAGSDRFIASYSAIEPGQSHVRISAYHCPKLGRYG
jgi:hypothetical protein